MFGRTVDDDWLTATTFGLLLQVTNTCNLHCRHCYDRSRRADMAVAQAAHVLDELERFCRRHWTEAHLDFTRGNPVPRDQLEAICRMKSPAVCQVSLEGRRTHNDWIRGAGSYDRALAFLGVLQETGVEPSVMLTATGKNLGEILPLAALLESRTNGFSLSRLSRSGERAALDPPDPARYRAFLQRYVEMASRSPNSTFREDLINLTLAESGQDLFEGCTGVGCGAAFNILAVLPDGGAWATAGQPFEHLVLRNSISCLSSRHTGRLLRRRITTARISTRKNAVTAVSGPWSAEIGYAGYIRGPCAGLLTAPVATEPMRLPAISRTPPGTNRVARPATDRTPANSCSK
jgi:MoaA/NifB/PqqE/SkfB family radical SAM enzyme